MEKGRHIRTELLLTFMKIGLFTFGGGYAMISMISYNCSERKKWIDSEEMLNLTVMAEATPGPIAINAATYIGYKQAGLSGALAATLGIVLPSFTVIYIIASLFRGFLACPAVSAAFHGIKLAVGVLILDAAVGMLKKMPKKPFQLSLMLLSFGAMLLINLLSLNYSSLELIALSALAGLIQVCCISAGAGKRGLKGGEK